MWDFIVQKDENSSIYHTERWLTVLEKVFGYKIFRLRRENIILPIALVKSFLFGNRLISLPFSDYGGFCGKGEIDEILEELKTISYSLDVDFIEIRCPHTKYVNSLRNAGFLDREDYCTFVLDLTIGKDKIWRNFEKRVRNGIRKANKNNIKVKELKNREELKDIYNLYLKTMKKLGTPPYSYKFFEEIYNAFYPRRMKILFALYNGKKISGMIFFLHNNKIYYSYSCSLKEYLKYRGNDAIIWHIIDYGIENGYKYIDFGRTRWDSGVFMYKKGWGGKLKPMKYFYFFNKKILEERQEYKYRRFSNIWSKYIPEFIANRIGHWIIKQVG